MPVLLDVTRPETTADALGTELMATASSLSARLADVAIVDLAALEQAVLDRLQIGDFIKRVQDFFSPLKQMAHRLHAALCERERNILAPLLTLDKAKAGAISSFKAQQDRERREREQVIAEQQRRARETEAAIEAAALEFSGDTVTAHAVLAEAIAAPAPVVALPDTTKTIEGLKFVRRWHWKFSGGPADVKATPPDVLARALALMPREFLMPDEKRIGSYVRSMKESGKIAGLDFYYSDDPVR